MTGCGHVLCPGGGGGGGRGGGPEASGTSLQSAWFPQSQSAQPSTAPTACKRSPVHTLHFKQAQRLRRGVLQDVFALMPLYLYSPTRQICKTRSELSPSCRVIKSTACLPFSGKVAALVVRIQHMLEALGGIGKSSLELVRACSLPLWNGPCHCCNRMKTALASALCIKDLSCHCFLAWKPAHS